MQKFVLILLGFILLSVNTFAQLQDKTLMTIGNKKITAGEFKYIYEKNNRTDQDKKSPDEYMDLFVKFKLKVVEAEHLKMDTVSKFINEFEGYKIQLAKPYLTENIKIDQLVKEAYERSKTDVKLDIIFVKMQRNASPEDTLKAYQKATDLRKMIINGTKWDSVALKFSDDRSASRNKGHLSFISTEKIPYGIQNYVFSSKENEISKPVRASSGYYLIRTVAKRPNPGSIKTAHIMISSPESLSKEEAAKKKERADSIYKALKNGADFTELAKLSDDKGSAEKGGELQWFSTGRMVPEFETAAFGLQNKGNYTEPVKTAFGWHIIKLIDTKPPKTFEESEEDLKRIVERDAERQEAVQSYVRYKLKKEFNFTEKNKPVKFHNLLDSTIFDAKWKLQDTDGLTQTLFTANNTDYTEKDFAEFIEINQKRRRKSDLKKLIDETYTQFITSALTDIEIAELANKEPDFRYLMQEYHDGLLLFELMEQEVWNKAVEDSAGLQKFYETNKERYKGQTELKITVFEYGKDKILKKAKKIISKNTNTQGKELASMVSSDENEFKYLESGTYLDGQNKYAEAIFEKTESGSKFKNGSIVDLPDMNALVLINDVIKGREKKLNEIRGLVISDFQTSLEEQWIKKLKAEYPVKINDTVFNQLKKEIKQ